MRQGVTRMRYGGLPEPSEFGRKSLAVLPGTTHFGVVKRDAWLEAMLDSFTESVV